MRITAALLVLALPATVYASLRGCTSDEDCFGSYCVTGPSKKGPFTCHKNNVPTKVIGDDVHGKAVELPMQGLGTWQYNNTVAGGAVAAALKMGYAHIDTAFDYENQKGIGEALKASPRHRNSYFITTKVQPQSLH